MDENGPPTSDREKPAQLMIGNPHPLVRALAWIWTHRLLSDRLRSHLMWWLNAKFAAGVTAVIVDDQRRVLFLEHAFRSRFPWALPGGWMSRGESPENAIVREVREETSLEVEVVDVLSATTFSLPRLDIVYLCRVRGGTVRGSAETPRWKWCPVGQYPPGADPYSIEIVELSQPEWIARNSSRFP